MQLDLLPTDVLLHRVDPSENMRRYYRLHIAPDLFGGCALVREWGRIGQSCRREVELHDTPGRALDRLVVVARQKKGRGYVVIA